MIAACAVLGAVALLAFAGGWRWGESRAEPVLEAQQREAMRLLEAQQREAMRLLVELAKAKRENLELRGRLARREHE